MLESVPVFGRAFTYVEDYKVPIAGVTAGVVTGEVVASLVQKFFNIKDPVKSFVLRAFTCLILGSQVVNYGIAKDDLFLKSMGIGIGSAIALEVVRFAAKKWGVAAAISGLKIPTIAQLVSFSEVRSPPVVRYPEREVSIATKEKTVPSIV